MSPPIHLYLIIHENYPHPTAMNTTICTIHFRLDAAHASLNAIAEHMQMQGAGNPDYWKRNVDGDALTSFTILGQNGLVLHKVGIERYWLG
jgi:hypothetical protein